MINRPRFEASRLGGLPAVKLVVQYRDRKTGVLRTCMAIAAIREGANPRETDGITYEITLDTVPSRLEEDEHVWQTVLGSFQLLPQ